jgi:uncharacterized protein YoxC
VHPLDTWQSIAVIVGTVLAILTVIIIPVWKKFRKFIKGWDLFMRDWQGEPDEPGRDAAPGIMERLNNIDGEFKRKSDGTTLKDAVATMSDTLEEVLKQLTGMNSRVTSMDERQERFESRLETIETKIDDKKDSE